MPVRNRRLAGGALRVALVAVAVLLPAACAGSTDDVAADAPPPAVRSPTATATVPASATPSATPTSTASATPAATPTTEATAGPALTPGPDSPSVEVVISGVSFGPTLHVEAGIRVRWVNDDQFTHDVRAEDGTWGSPELGEGEAYERWFGTPGTYRYYCSLHLFMQGEVVVE